MLRSRYYDLIEGMSTFNRLTKFSLGATSIGRNLGFVCWARTAMYDGNANKLYATAKQELFLIILILFLCPLGRRRR